MNAYVDSSVLLRIVLRQPNALREWGRIRRAVASSLVEVECLRTLDRFRLRTDAPIEDIARKREAVFALLRTTTVVQPTRAVLDRASQPLPTPLGTLGAIHLATALVWREVRGENLVIATHDGELGLAARSCGLGVVGL